MKTKVYRRQVSRKAGSDNNGNRNQTDTQRQKTVRVARNKLTKHIELTDLENDWGKMAGIC